MQLGELEITLLNQISIRKETDELGIKIDQLIPKYIFEIEWNKKHFDQVESAYVHLTRWLLEL